MSYTSIKIAGSTTVDDFVFLCWAREVSKKIPFPLYISFVISHFMDWDLSLYSCFLLSLFHYSSCILPCPSVVFLFPGFEDPGCLSQLAELLGLSWGIIEWAWLGVKSSELALTALVGIHSLRFVILSQYALF